MLLVEDDPDVRAYAAQALRIANYRVVPAADAETAMALLTAGDVKIDVLFSDIVLPGEMNGWALAEAARKEFPELRIVLTSGNWDLSDAGPSRSALDAAVLQKPYSRKELAQVLQATIDKGISKRGHP